MRQLVVGTRVAERAGDGEVSEKDNSGKRPRLSKRALYALLTAQLIEEMSGFSDNTVFDILTDQEREEIANAGLQSKTQQETADAN